MPETNPRELFTRRMACLRERLEGAGAFVETSLINIQYLTGFTGSAAILVLTPKEAILLTDSRYTIQARQEVRSARVRIAQGSLMEEAGALLAGRGRLQAAYSPSRITVLQLQKLQHATGRGVRWLQRDGLVERIRAVKDENEIAAMREAARVAGNALRMVLPLVKPGVRESDLAAEIEYQVRKGGASGPSFDTIVASGSRSALPHARPTEKRVGKNELVVFDLGAILRGYCSDLTRTVFVGRAPARIQNWYHAVLEAQQAARAAVKDRARAADVDAAARKVLKKAGLAKYFSHSTGHGLGMEVHEMPSLSRMSEDVLQSGQVVTLEPGVYVKGTGGIRIEDDVVVKANGSEGLTHLDRELLEL